MLSVVVKPCRDIHDPQRMNPNDLGERPDCLSRASIKMTIALQSEMSQQLGLLGNVNATEMYK